MARRMRKGSALLYLLTASILCSPTIGDDTVTPARPLVDDGGTTLISASGSFELGFFSPAGSSNRYIGIWYHRIPVQTVVWVANRQRPVTGSSGKLSLETDGALVITDGKNSTVIWSSGSLVLGNPVARLLDNGNFVVEEEGSDDDQSSFAWQSFDFLTDTLLPGMKIGWNLTSGLDRNLTAWRSVSDPAPGVYANGIDKNGNPQIFLWSRSHPYWRGGSWNGRQFGGVQQMMTGNVFDKKFVVDAREIVYSFYMRDPSVVSRLVMNQSGILQRLVWHEDSEMWSVFWSAPQDQCDYRLSPCGPYGVCYPNEFAMCKCLQGFHPKNPSRWSQRDGTDGCVRNTALDCRNGTDGFITLSSVKIPDTSTSMVVRSMSLEECEVLCRRNCSCKAYASANISGTGSGSGCIIWTTELTDIKMYDSGSGQDIYVRLAAADLGSESNQSHRNHVVVIIIVVSALATFILLSVPCFVWKRKKRRNRYIDEETHEQDMDLPLYDLDTIADATGNFSTDNKLGEGGFGPVYKGKLRELKEIAVKRLSETSTQGLAEFKNEVTLIAKLQHRNLVRLLGCCIQAGERMLIYEYMPHGSLDSVLFGAMLDWQTRYNIIVGIARGLLYLHRDSRFRIIHRDLKASNILLDKDMNPKISDFGMARMFGGDETDARTRRVVGTYGYMSPEYAMDGIFSVKSDVFSFGVLVLEIVSGKKNRGVYQSSHHLNLLAHVWSLWNEGKGLELADASMGPSSLPVAEVMKCIKVGLLCVQDRPEYRPTMSSVVEMLGGDSALLPQPRQPGFIVAKDSSETNSSTSKQDSSTNHVSMTMLEGR
ncbi:receptor-like serine/threonine-protein kinase SD1-8 isoform X2 [Musa acuminata AAA Group]|uniref:receptor-like serine/threonine-protein kinase SD1-8 isoform X2 n=1 Tax=Musa acuminata AAA Group TaxID=214697 RepID=UPI0031DF446F